MNIKVSVGDVVRMEGKIVEIRKIGNDDFYLVQLDENTINQIWVNSELITENITKMLDSMDKEKSNAKI